MKKLFFVAMAAFALYSCSQKPEHQSVRPLPSELNLEKISDGSFPAVFSVKDFNWRGSNLTLTVFAEDIYDGKQVDNLQPGDTVFFRGDTIIFKEMKLDKDYLTINGGIEEGGADLQKTKDGNYRGMQMDDHSTYTKLGKAELMLADDFTIIDCGDNPEDPYDTIRTSQKQYLDGVKEYKKDFMELNTIVTVKNGHVTNITRHWIP